MKTRSMLWMLSLTVLFVVLAHSGAMGQSMWKAQTGSWFVAGNWTAGRPTVTSDGRIDNGGTALIEAPGAVVRYLDVGFNMTGFIEISGGGTLGAHRGYLGTRAGSHGTATVTGSGSAWTNNSYFYVGDQGIGTLTIAGGGQVSNTWGYLGYSSGSHGTALVTGGGATWTNTSGLSVGVWGTGTLTVEDGGQVFGNGARIAYWSGSNGTATVTGSGSSWTSATSLTVGTQGIGTMTVDSGGQLSNVNGFLATNMGSQGTLTIDGPESAWLSSGSVYVGGSQFSSGGSGELNIRNGALVNVAGGLTVWREGTVNLESGTLRANQIYNFSDGPLNVTGGTLQANTFWGNLVNDGGTVSPGLPADLSLGIFAITGDYTQTTSGRLLLDVFGISSGDEHDVLSATGHMSLAGTLDVVLGDGYVPQAGDTFGVLSFGSLSGKFDAIGLPALAPALAWDTSNLYTAGTLAVQVVLGDFNGDGVLSGLDIPGFKAALADPQGWGDANLNMPLLDILGDFNGDGMFSGLDIPGFKMALAGAGAAAIPEPATSLILLAGALTLARRRHRLL